MSIRNRIELLQTQWVSRSESRADCPGAVEGGEQGESRRVTDGVVRQRVGLRRHPLTRINGSSNREPLG